MLILALIGLDSWGDKNNPSDIQLKIIHFISDLIDNTLENLKSISLGNLMNSLIGIMVTSGKFIIILLRLKIYEQWKF